ncbi:succinyl-CoA synthetase, beta subunit [Candidatus Nitrospira nitrosa]|uniref:Succinate--CoA ligase [ADP-forming] subunit beta n=1 Tax=Candidatus Nitrospira nitrosa TaxID=1742972 RepID=A0A0S4LHP4_9BACT|nr:ADP-forming succinate--CoA ligase subunit beta [Candidatus Nitrospira nitrosa]CUS36234.1 succinyl-CoA synthetase, beta subunit [Candidatus Nitrospira nitrosa]
MNVHEFQAKSLFAQFGVPVPRGKEITSPEAATAWATELNTPVFVVKAQIHAGGRGKAGGVKITKDKAAVAGFAKELIGKTLVTHQTGPKGRQVHRLLMEEGANIAKELYLSILVDRETGWPTFIASTEGGMEIEEVAAKTPEKIIKEPIDPAVGFQGYNGRNIAFALGLQNIEPTAMNPFIKMLGNLYRLFMEKNCALVEINPLIITKEKTVVALDGKVSFDDNGLFKHEDVQKMRDLNEEEPLEIEATANNLNYVKLDGNIGCMVNGAGLAMATMDVIKLAGSEPANFLDVGGGATKETVAAGFRILLKDPNVKGIFINIFGGIVRCERIAHGVIEAAKEVKINVPLVVRLQGTNAEEGRQLLADSGLKLDVANDLWEAAQKIVKLTGKAA